VFTCLELQLDKVICKINVEGQSITLQFIIYTQSYIYMGRHVSTSLGHHQALQEQITIHIRLIELQRGIPIAYKVAFWVTVYHHSVYRCYIGVDVLYAIYWWCNFRVLGYT
jgi:hypothetical protein